MLPSENWEQELLHSILTCKNIHPSWSMCKIWHRLTESCLQRRATSARPEHTFFRPIQNYSMCFLIQERGLKMVRQCDRLPFNPLAQAADPASQNIPSMAVTTKSTYRDMMRPSLQIFAKRLVWVQATGGGPWSAIDSIDSGIMLLEWSPLGSSSAGPRTSGWRTHTQPD